MKFLISKELNSKGQLRWLLSFYLFMAFCFICLNTFLEASLFGLLPINIKQLVLGDPALFLEPLPLEDLLVQIHIRLFFMSTLYLVLFAIYFRMKQTFFVHSLWPILGLSFTIGDSLALILMPFFGGTFAYLKSLSFFGQQLTFLTMIVASMSYLLIKPKTTSSSATKSEAP